MRQFLAVAALVAVSTTPIQAQNYSSAPGSAWRAELITSNNNKPMCTLGNIRTDRSVYFKYAHGDNNMIVHAFKNGWVIPQGIVMPITMRIDDSSGWAFMARGLPTGNGIEWDVPQEMVAEFGQLFRSGLHFRLLFHSGNEGVWQAGLRGSSQALTVFGRCIAGLSPSTQPFTGVDIAPSQPFSSPSLSMPSQPFSGAIKGPSPGR